MYSPLHGVCARSVGIFIQKAVCIVLCNVSTQRCNTMSRSDGSMEPEEKQSNEIDIAMKDAARWKTLRTELKYNALEDVADEIKIAEDCENRFESERDAARERYCSARVAYKLAQKWKQIAVREVQVATDREKTKKGELDVAGSRYKIAKRRCQVTQQRKLEMEKAEKHWKENMQDLALWERATQDTCPSHRLRATPKFVPRMSGHRAARHLNCGSPSFEEDESEEHEETPALPTLLPMSEDEYKGKDENESKEDDAVTRESVSAMPASTPVAANRWQLECNVDVQKRCRIYEGGGFKIDGRERSTTDAYSQTKRRRRSHGWP